jgi:hypothetical protein
MGAAKMIKRLVIAVRVVEMAMAQTKTKTAMTREEVVVVVAMADVEVDVVATMPPTTSPTSRPEKSKNVSVAYIPR